MKKMLYFLFFLTACGTSKEIIPEVISNTGVNYTIQPLLNVVGEEPMVSVQLFATTNELGKIILGYKNEGWGEKDLFNCLIDLQTTPKTEIKFKRAVGEIVLSGKPNKVYSIQYKVKQDITEKLTADKTMRPIVNKDYFHIFGENLLALPLDLFEEDTSHIDINILWKSDDMNHRFVNSFGSENNQKLKLDYVEIAKSVFTGGKLNVYQKKYGKEMLTFATAENWEHLDLQKAQEDLYSIVQLQNDFWKISTPSPTTVTLFKTFENCLGEKNCNNACSGTGLTNSFSTFSSDNLYTSNERINWLFAHELFHHWVGSQIKNESDVVEYWFSEGFTNYYSYKLLLKANMMTIDEFIAKVNEEVIEPHYTSKINQTENINITKEKFWSDKEFEQLPYRRGFLYAFYLDSKIKEVDPDRSLDDVMQDIYAMTVPVDFMFNEHVFKEVLNSYHLEQSEIEFEKYITRGELIDLTQLNIKVISFDKGAVPYMKLDDERGADRVKEFFTN